MFYILGGLMGKSRMGSTVNILPKSWHYFTFSAHFSSLNSVSDVDLEAQKRREYEEWFKLQEKEAMEYSACVKYHEKIGESEDVTVTEVQQQQDITTTETKVKTGRIVLTVVHILTPPTLNI